MSHQSELIEKDILAYLAQHERKEILRFLTCGSVDDGKSTLIGRLLHDSKMIYEDQLAAVRQESKTQGSAGEDKVDLALLMDGLKAEREQGITIDVAYRYFSTSKRKFIIADCPGHEQYTRNMVTGASTCDLAIILIDARKGVLPQTKRHSFIVSALGIRHVVVAVNKMDLVNFDQAVFEKIVEDYKEFAARLKIPDLHFLPMSALNGDNVVEPSEALAWHQGPSLMTFLEQVHVGSDRNFIDMRFPVQYVNRPDLNFRGYCGTLASGVVRKGDEVMALPSRKRSKVASIICAGEEVDEGFTPMALTLTLEDEIDISRGDMIVHPGNIPQVDRDFEALVVWMAEEPMAAGREYLFLQTSKTTPGVIEDLRYRIDINTLHRQEASGLALNEIGRCRISVDQPLSFDPYENNRGTGGFIIIDRMTNGTVAAGMVLARESADANNLWQRTPFKAAEARKAESLVSSEQRQARSGHTGAVLLLTGLSGSGKTSIALEVERQLFEMGASTIAIDGQNMRIGLSRDLGYTSPERAENMRRGAELSALLADAGQIVVLSFTAPDAAVRERARRIVGEDRFFEIHVSTPIEVCRERDPVGIYERADRGEFAEFPGVNARYDEPENPALRINAAELDIAGCASAVLGLLRENKILSGDS